MNYIKRDFIQEVLYFAWIFEILLLITFILSEELFYF